MNEERTGLLLRRMEHVHGYLLHRKDWIVITTNGTCPWLFVTQKGLDCYYDEWNMSMVICYTDRTGLLLRRMEHVHGYLLHRKDWIVITTNGTCPWLFVTQKGLDCYYDEWNMSMVICYTERTGLLLRRMEHVHDCYYDEWNMFMVITTNGTCPWLLRRMEHVHGYYDEWNMSMVICYTETP